MFLHTDGRSALYTESAYGLRHIRAITTRLVETIIEAPTSSIKPSSPLRQDGHILVTLKLGP